MWRRAVQMHKDIADLKSSRSLGYLPHHHQRKSKHENDLSKSVVEMRSC